MAAALTDVLDEIEILVAADLLDADEHDWCPGLQGDTMSNPCTSRSQASVTAQETTILHHNFNDAYETRHIPRVTRLNRGQSAEVGLEMARVQAQEVEPNEFVPLPAGTNLALGYYIYGDETKFNFAKGNTFTDKTGLQVNFSAARDV
jgi:hypothetical protein